jgi:hypothetical protein
MLTSALPALLLPLLAPQAAPGTPGEAHLDILPGMCPNTLDVSLTEGPGTVRGSVLGNDFDVTQVDLGSMHGVMEVESKAGMFVLPINADLRDTSTPLVDGRECECQALGPDGILDIELTFDRDELIAAFGLNLEQDGSTFPFAIEGMMQDPEGDGMVPFVARGDCILVENPDQPIQSFCAGDTTAMRCPCENDGLPGRGCDNPQATGGVRLSVESFDPQAQHALFVGQGFPAKSTPAAVLIRSDAQAGGGNGVGFGDGLRCLAVPLRRVRSALAAGGSVSFDVHHTLGEGLYDYQIWYRSNPQTFCAPDSAFNLSNGVSVPW